MKNNNYWRKRAEKSLTNAEKKENETIEEIEKKWNKIDDEITGEFRKIYFKYKEGENPHFYDFLKNLSEEELEEFRNKIKRYIDGEEDKDFLNRIHFYLTKKNIKRIEEVKVIFKIIIEIITREIEEEIARGMEHLFEKSYMESMYYIQKGINTGVEFRRLEKEEIKTIVREKWLGENYEDRIKRNKVKLLDALEKELLRGISVGENPRKIAKRLRDKIKISKSNAERIARTEFNNIVNQANFKSMEDINKQIGSKIFNKYRFLATLDKRTSEICQELDLKEFRFEEKEVGVNFPPVHPNCRSTFEIVINGEEISERISKNLETGKVEYISGNISYKEWERRFVG